MSFLFLGGVAVVYDLIVVGGGPAGMLGASTAGARGLKVILLEKNEKLGRKLYLTGKGRCNITNACNLNEFFSHVINNEKFLYSSLNTFDNQRLVTLVESQGVKTKVERGNQIGRAHV